MRVGRTLPPAAATIGWLDFVAGLGAQAEGAPAVHRLEAELSAYFGVRYCFLVSSGKAALALILLSLKDLHPDRDEVMVPAFTCYSVASSIVRAGLRARLCDVNQAGLDFDPAKLAAEVPRSERLLAVIPTHLYGVPADVARVRQFVGKRPITVIEDAAQAMGGNSQEGKLGTLGDVGFFSLGRGKAFSTVEGGVILTNREDLALALRARIQNLPGYGAVALSALIAKAVALVALLHPLLFWIPRSLPFLRLGETLFERDFPLQRLSAFQAGLARNWQRRLETMRDARRRNVQQWLALLDDLGERDLGILRKPCPAAVRFPLRIADPKHRAVLLQRSASEGAGIAPGYPQAINRLADLAGAVQARDCATAERVARELVTLPTHAYVSKRDVARVRRLLQPAFGAGISSISGAAAPRDSRTHQA